MKGCYDDGTGSGTFDSSDSEFEKDSPIRPYSCMLLARADCGTLHVTRSKGTCCEAGPC